MSFENILFLQSGNSEEAKQELKKIGCHSGGIEIMADKMIRHLIKIKDIDARAANIIKQEAISVGADAAVSKDVSMFTAKNTDIIIIANDRQHYKIIEKLKRQPFGLKIAAKKIKEKLDMINSKEKIYIIGGKTFDFSKKTYVMGILNVTPDSFSDGGKYMDYDSAMKRAENIFKQGADIIDIGAESSRPGSKSLPKEVELERIIPVVEGIVKNFDIPISIDTYKSEVAEETLKRGAHIINDISGFNLDKEMGRIVAKYGAHVVLMHMQGEPENMQEAPDYDNVTEEIIGHLEVSVRKAQESLIAADKIIIDPGIGFGKSVEHNLEILRRLRDFKTMGYPLLLGTSRKSFIGKITNEDTDKRLEGSLASEIIGAAFGAAIIRVHDVEETVRAMKVTDAILKYKLEV